MTHWLFPANTKFYDVFGAFGEAETYWPVNTKVSAGDVVYIYLAAPYKQIGYVCDVMEVGLDLDSIVEKVRPFFKNAGDNKKQPKSFMKLQTNVTIPIDNETHLAYRYLKQNGLNGMLTGPRKLENNPELLDYIKRSIP
jgi:hypothetical protein